MIESSETRSALPCARPESPSLESTPSRVLLSARDAVAPLGIEIRAGVHTCECEIIMRKVGGP